MKTIYRIVVHEVHIVASMRLVVAENLNEATSLARTIGFDDQIREVGDTDLVDVIDARVAAIEDTDVDHEMARMEISENYGADMIDAFFTQLE